MLTSNDVMEAIKRNVEKIAEEELKTAQERIKDRVKQYIPSVVMSLNDHFRFKEDPTKLIIEVIHKSRGEDE